MREIRNTSVCVVGGAGFLGSHLVHHLIEDRQCDVVVIDNLSAGQRSFVHHKAMFIHHDITLSESYLCDVFDSQGVRFVFNYAAWPYIPDSFSRPLQVFAVNATGAIQVINAAQDAGVDAILQVSSAELYGDKVLDSQEINELAVVHPHSSYGASKAAVDYYCQAAWRERETPVVILRQFNCVGACETHPYVVPEIISQVHADSVVTCNVCFGTKENPDDDNRKCTWCQGTGFLENDNVTVHLGNNSERDFLFAGDAVRMAVELLEKATFGEIYNMGSGESIRIYDLAQLIGHLMGKRNVHIEKDEARMRPWEIWSLRSDNQKLWATIGHRPLTPLRNALERTIEDFHDNGGRWCWEHAHAAI